MIKFNNISIKLLAIASYHTQILNQFGKFSLFFLSPHSYAKLSKSTINKIKNIVNKYHPIKLYYLCLKPVKNQKIYVHIGMPKTGSSAIQAFLALNKKYLKNNGFSYPNHTGFKQAFQTSAGNAAEISAWIKNENFEMFERFITKVRSKNVILSSEILFASLRDYPEKFALFFSKYDIKIICYIREMGDLVESVVNQRIKNHNLVDYSNIENNIAGINYYHCLLNAIRYIDSKNIIIKKYQKESFYQGNIYADFMKILGLELSANINLPEKNVNPSLNRDALEFRIIFNKVLFGKNNIQLKYRLNSELAHYSVENQIKPICLLLSSEKRTKIKSNNREIEKKFIEIFFSNSDEDLFINKPLNFKHYKGLTHKTILQILIFIKTHDQELFYILIKFCQDSLLIDDRKKLEKAIESINDMSQHTQISATKQMKSNNKEKS